MWFKSGLFIVLAYLIGSLPFAYLLVKWRYKRKVTQEGTGNVGTFNVLRTTKSKPLSFAVLLMDFLKGFAAIYIGRYFFIDYPVVWGAMAVFVVIGHNYTVWLGFKGGRGLATSAGVVVVLAPMILLIWLIIWAVLYLILRQIIYSSVFAVFACMFFIWWPNEKFVSFEVAIPISIMSIFIIIKHIPRLKDGWMKRSIEPSP